MKNILLFLQKYGYWLLFLFFETIAVILYVSSANFPRSAAIASSNAIAGSVYSVTGYFSSFLFSRKENARLLRQVERLETENRGLLEQLRSRSDTFFTVLPIETFDEARINYRSITANVINNSVARPQNYLTLNKGRADGISEDMGVVSADGIVGVVSAVSEHYSTVISVLNAKMKVSCKLKGGSFFGSLSWDGINDPRFAILKDLPRHAVFEKGDTVLTSGFSVIFPEGVIVGRVEDFTRQKDDDFYALKIKLATDFYALYQVRILVPENAAERVELEKRNQYTTR